MINLTKKIFRKFAEIIVLNDVLWHFISRSLVRGSQFLCSVRDQHEVERIVQRYSKIRDALADRKVISGPFEGMKYGSTKAFCSALYPKLLGVYENELSKIIFNALTKKYKIIVDVGAADGYYAVGFALKNTEAKIIAYEMDARARAELVNLSTINGVADRIEIREKCEPSDLMNQDGDHGLMIMDCEGYEDFLLIPDVINRLRTWDFIIETHDGYLPDISLRLSDRFSSTHTVISVEVIHDLNKADQVKVSLLKEIPRRDVDKLLAENRQHACLRWIVCYAHSSLSSD